MDIDTAVSFMRTNHRAVLATNRRDGSVQLTPVAVGVIDDAPVVSSRETAFKTKHLLRDPRASLCVMTDGFYGEWIYVDATCEVVHLPDAMELLVEYFRQVSGEHPDWDEYRAAMTRDQRVILKFTIVKAGPDRHG